MRIVSFVSCDCEWPFFSPAFLRDWLGPFLKRHIGKFKKLGRGSSVFTAIAPWTGNLAIQIGIDPEFASIGVERGPPVVLILFWIRALAGLSPTIH
jgi:hypothetical protein